MGVKELVIFALALCIFRVTQAQYYGRMRGLNSFYKDHCSYSCEDLSSIIALARILEDKETITPAPSPPPTTPSLGNFEELIMKLVNALVYTTTETAKNTCCCSQTTTPTTETGCNNQNSKEPEISTSSNTHRSNSGGALVSVDVLNNNKNDNLLDVDVAQQLVERGRKDRHRSSDRKPSGTNQYPMTQNYPNQNNQPTTQPTRQQNGNSENDLINLDLLNPNKKDNVAELDLGRQSVLGVSLGGGGSTPPNKYNNDYPNNVSNPKDLIELDLLNPNKQNNVLDLEPLLGVGLGN